MNASEVGGSSVMTEPRLPEISGAEWAKAEAAARIFNGNVIRSVSRQLSPEAEFFNALVKCSPKAHPQAIFDAMKRNKDIATIVGRYPTNFRKVSLYWGKRDFVKLIADIITWQDRKDDGKLRGNGGYLVDNRINEWFNPEYMSLLLAFQEYHKKLFPHSSTDIWSVS